MKPGWSDVALGDVATIDRRVVEPDEIENDTMFVGLEHLVPGGGLTGVVAVSSGEIASAKFAFDGRHVLLGKLRPNLAKSARPDFSGVCSTDILPIRPSPKLDRNFLAHFVAWPRTVALAAQRATGANLPRLSPAQLEAFRLPLPPVAEQRRIGDALDAAHRLCAPRRQTSEVLQRLEATLIASSPVERSVPVADLLDEQRGGIRTGPFGSQLLHSEFVDEGIQVLGIDNAVANEFKPSVSRHITEAKFKQLKRYAVHPGDVLITIMGTNGRAAVVPDDIGVAINTKHLCCITLDRGQCLPRYLHAYFLHHPVAHRYLKRRAKGAIMEGLNMGIIKELPVALPNMEEQRATVEMLMRIDLLREHSTVHGERLEELFASLQQRAFAGEL